MAAAGHGWKALAVWSLAPVAYAVTSDTFVGTLRAHVIAQQKELDTELADDAESTPLAIVGKAFLYGARFLISPISTLRGAKAALINATPLPEPAKKAEPAEPKARGMEIRHYTIQEQLAYGRRTPGEKGRRLWHELTDREIELGG